MHASFIFCIYYDTLFLTCKSSKQSDINNLSITTACMYYDIVNLLHNTAKNSTNPSKKLLHNPQ